MDGIIKMIISGTVRPNVVLIRQHMTATIQLKAGLCRAAVEEY